MTIRNFDEWECYDNGRGLPLNGKFTFYKRGTSQKISITDVDGTPLSNPILSDMYGRTRAQVFLPYEDVTVVMHQYIGSGTMSEADTDDSHWTLIRSVDSLYPRTTFTESGEVESVQISTMEDLRVVDPRAHNYYTLLGYYELGDMPPVNYVVEYNPTATDNGGSVIRVDTMFILRMIPGKVIDVRSFGVFPKSTYNTPTPYASQLALAFSYANSIGRDVYMPAVFQGATSYYWLEGGVFSIAGKLIVDWRARISAKSGTTNVMHIGEIQHDGGTVLFTKQGGNGDITCNVSRGKVRSSWLENTYPSWQGTVFGMILDEVRANVFTVDNMSVDVERTISNRALNFNGCSIKSDKKFLNCDLSFDSCGIVSDMWIDPATSQGQISLYGNTIRLDHMTSANAYVEWKLKQSEINFGDLGEQAVAITVPNGSLIENANGIINLSGGSGTTEIHNFSGTINGLTTATQLNMVDCYVTIYGAGCGSLMLQRGSLTTAPQAILQFIGFVNLNKVELTGGGLEVLGGLNVLDCVVHSNLYHHQGGTIYLNFVRNLFDAHLYIAGEIPNTIVSGKIVGNTGMAEDPIIVDRTNLDPFDSHHLYTYADNSGTFLPYVTKPEFHEYTIKHRSAIGDYYKRVVVDPYTILQNVVGGSDDDRNGRPSGYMLPYAYSNFFDQIKMFRFGVDVIPVLCSIVSYPGILTTEGATGEYQYNRVCQAYLGAYYISGNTWGIKPYWDDMTAEVGHLTSANHCPFLFRGSLSFSLNNMPSFNDYHWTLAMRYECLDKRD